jgi:hypothetical protein
MKKVKPWVENKNPEGGLEIFQFFIIPKLF